MAPDLTRTMEEAKASETVYYLIKGELTLVSQETLPRTDIPPNWHGPASDFPNPVRAQMRFSGVSLSPHPSSDFAITDFPITVETSCAAHWCGGLPAQARELIMFVEARPGATPLLRVGACPQFVFYPQAGDSMVRTLRSLF